jgi:hypothetical protein
MFLQLLEIPSGIAFPPALATPEMKICNLHPAFASPNRAAGTG